MALLLTAAHTLTLVLDPTAACLRGFVASSSSLAPRMQILDYDPETYDPEKGGLGTLSSDRPEGSHSTGYRFMPLQTMAKGAAPALVCIAGLYPGITADELMAPQPLPFAPDGRWNYHVLKSEASSSGFVALPGSQLLSDHPDTVAVVCSSRAMGLDFPDGGEHEVLALIDRSDLATMDMMDFDENRFYALADETGRIHIRWIEAVPQGWRVLGRLLYTQMPLVRSGNEGTGFAENDDEFEF